MSKTTVFATVTTSTDTCYACGHPSTQEHSPTCPRRLPCGYPPGCPNPAMPGWQLCQQHYDAVYALFGPPDTADLEAAR